MSEENRDQGINRIESWAKIFSLAAIPIVLAVGGWMIQSTMKQQDIKQSYVQLAISILKAPANESDPRLRKWAIGLFNSYSLVKIDKDTANLIIEGKIRFPDSTKFKPDAGLYNDSIPDSESESENVPRE